MQEFEDYKGEPKSKAIAQAAQDLGISYSTLHRLLHGTLQRMTWRTIRILRAKLTPPEWELVQCHLWLPRRRPEFERRLTQSLRKAIQT